VEARLTFLEENPGLKEKLLSWERNAPEDIKIRIERLRTDTLDERIGIAASLGEEGPRAKGAILALIENLKENAPLPQQRRSLADEAAKALGKIGEPALEPLIKALKDKDWRVRCGAASALGEMGHRAAIQPLTETLLGDEEGEVRWKAARALSRMKWLLEDTEPLIEAIRDEDWRVRYEVVKIIGELEEEKAIGPLIEALKDASRDVRGEAAQALMKMGSKAVEPLIEALEEGDREVRVWIVCILGKLGDKRAIKPLMERLKDEDWTVREFAKDALKMITGEDFD